MNLSIIIDEQKQASVSHAPVILKWTSPQTAEKNEIKKLKRTDSNETSASIVVMLKGRV